VRWPAGLRVKFSTLVVFVCLRLCWRPSRTQIITSRHSLMGKQVHLAAELGEAVPG
jgi:hypothetical protein